MLENTGTIEFIEDIANLRAGLDSNVIVWSKPKTKEKGWNKTNYTVKAAGDKECDICYTFPVKINTKNHRVMMLDDEVVKAIYKKTLLRSRSFLQSFRDLKEASLECEYEPVELFGDPRIGGTYKFEVNYDCKRYNPPLDFDLKLIFRMFILKQHAIEIIKH